MEELVSAAATIQGAQIQANYALWAAAISSIVGTAGIVFAAWYAWKSGIKLHQHNNIIEARREVYLELNAQWIKFLSILPQYQLIEHKEYFLLLLKAKEELNIALAKGGFLSEPETKLKINEFSISSSEFFNNIIPQIDYWYKCINSNNPVDSESAKLVKMDIYEKTIILSKDATRLEILLRNELGICNNVGINKEIDRSTIEFQERARVFLSEL